MRVSKTIRISRFLAAARHWLFITAAETHPTLSAFVRRRRQRKWHASAVSTQERAPLRILCAEDDAQLAPMLKAALERAGHFVECVDDGHKALVRISCDKRFFDVLVTDHHMPHLSGLGLVSKLRDTPYSGRIVVHSSALTPAERQAFEALAVDAILSKPASLATLLASIQQAIETTP